MFVRIICGGALLVGIVGCIHKPEGPAERIGRSIDEISSAIDDMGRDDETQRDRIRRERERREREASNRRDRFEDRVDPQLEDPIDDDPLGDTRDEFAPRDDDEFGSESARYGDDSRYDQQPLNDRGQDRY